MFRAVYGHCHSAVFSAPYGHCIYPLPPLCSGNEVPGLRTASRQIDAAAGHSCHFNTVLYPRSYSECQLPLNGSRRHIPGAASSVQNYGKIFAESALPSPAPLQTCQHIYNAI